VPPLFSITRLRVTTRTAIRRRAWSRPPPWRSGRPRPSPHGRARHRRHLAAVPSGQSPSAEPIGPLGRRRPHAAHGARRQPLALPLHAPRARARSLPRVVLARDGGATCRAPAGWSRCRSGRPGAGAVPPPRTLSSTVCWRSTNCGQQLLRVAEDDRPGEICADVSSALSPG
jgi:hypothetical protein